MCTQPLCFKYKWIENKFNRCVDPHYIDADPDPACHLNEDPEPTFHFDADPDPNFQINAQNTESVQIGSYSIPNIFRLAICKLMRIWIQFITLMRMRIRILHFNLIGIHANPDPQHWIEKNISTWILIGFKNNNFRYLIISIQKRNSRKTLNTCNIQHNAYNLDYLSKDASQGLILILH